MANTFCHVMLSWHQIKYHFLQVSSSAPLGPMPPQLWNMLILVHKTLTLLVTKGTVHLPLAARLTAILPPKKTPESLFYLMIPLEHVDFHIIGYWMSSLWSL